MMDTISAKERSNIMSRVKSKNTRPEMFIRRMLHRAGFRYRLHDTTLPGKPDIVFPRKRKIIFVNGCFWHRHEGCKQAKIPKSNQVFWHAKLEGNKMRDKCNLRELHNAGWETMIVWECELKDVQTLEKKLLEFLSGETTLQPQ
ncbi:very short patch repair endonuclease [Pseudomonas asplenii]|nr:very short patch repair endonuclease [Pseudomonas fuscovaginae]